MYSYPIVAYAKGKKGFIIDITKDVNATGKLFAFPNLQWVNRPVAERSGLDSIYVIKDGVKFQSLHTQTDYMPAMMPGGVGYDKHNTVLLEWTLQLLPARSVALRKADKRVGFTSVSFNDYDIDPAKARSISYVRRWNLQPKAADIARYQAGELVEPENPIKVYIDTTFHASMRRAAIRGVEEWNNCLEKAGFRKALVVCEGMPETMFAYHQVVLSYAMVVDKMQTVTDSRTGEIVCGVGSISDYRICETEKDMRIVLGSYAPKLFATDSAIMREELCRYYTSQLIGKMLGLEPNLGGSMAFTVEQLRDAKWVHEHGISASVTDGIAYNYVVQPGDNIPLRDLFSKASVYDEWAIEWGYRLYPGATKEQERAALGKLAGKAADNPYLKFVSASKKGYMAAKFDLSSDKMRAAELGMQNLQRMLPKLEGLVNQLDQEDYWYKYWEFAPQLYTLYSLYVLQAIDYLGSICREPVIAGYNENPYSIAPKALQERALQFVVKHAFQKTPAWMYNETMRKIAGYTGDDNMGKLATNVALRLCSPEMMANLMASQLQFGKDAFTLDDMNKVLDKVVFLDFSAQKTVSPHLTGAQYAFVKQYAEHFCKVRDGKLTDDVSMYVAARMQKVYKAIERLSRTHVDAGSRSHYRGLLVYINRKLVAKGETAIAVKK
ncbi:MAG: zinc-dependent metalloprotease, partial [Prevotella sp.]